MWVRPLTADEWRLSVAQTLITPKTPWGRIKRSAVQAVVGFIPSVLVMVNQSHLTAAKAGRYGGTSVLSVLAVAVIQNYAESKGWIGTAKP
jgi:hypothetical protein